MERLGQNANRRGTRRARIGASGWALLRMLAPLAIVAGLAVAGWAFATTYVYDANGRLVVATNDAGQSARYVYDAMGNLAEVQRLGPDDLAIFGFSPARGAPGTQVRVQGHGFAPDPAGNALSFNGALAQIQSAAFNELTAIVPVGATTGPLTVQVAGQVATSNTHFVVDESLRPPVIHSVSPLVGTVGTTITVTGESLQPVIGQTTARLNLRPTRLTTVTDTQVVFPIPSATGSGSVTIGTPLGTTNSQLDVLVVPGGIDPALVVQVKRLSVDAPPESLATVNTGEYVAVLFDAVAGDYLAGQFAQITGNVAYTLYDTMNRQIAAGTATAANPTALLPVANVAGTYLLMLRPATGPSAWSLRVERARAIPINGEVFEVSAPIPGKRERHAFRARAGQNLGLGISDLALSSGSSVNITIFNPGGSFFSSVTCSVGNGGCGLNIEATITGVYTVVMTPSGASQTMQYKLSLSDDLTGTLIPDAIRTLTISRRGQNGRLKFSAVSGDAIALQISTLATVPAGRNVYYRVYRPNGVQLTSTSANGPALLNLPNLPETGSYTVFVDSYYGETLQTKMILSTGSAGGEQVDGSGGEYETAIGQHVYLTFQAAAGQRLGLGISDLSVSSGSFIRATVYSPNGATLLSEYCYANSNGCGLNIAVGQAGKYSVILAPQSSSQAMSFKTTLSADLSSVLTRGVVQPLMLPRRGQNAWIRFFATAGETVAMRISEPTTTPSGRSIYYYIYKPDGTILESHHSLTDLTLNFSSLPETGEYKVFIDPRNGETLGAGVSFIGTPVGTQEVDGSGAYYENEMLGQSVYLTFAASAGQRLGLGISDLSLSSDAGASVAVTGPDGSYLTSEWCLPSGCGLNISAIQAGIYTIEVTSVGMTRFRATLSTEASAVLVRDEIQALTLARRGQNGRLIFTAVSGDALALQVAQQTTLPTGGVVYYTIYRPDGGVLASTSTVSAATLLLLNLPETGEYQVFVDPGRGESLSAGITLSTGAAGGEEIDGASGEHENSPGQPVYLTFTAAAGQRINLGVSDLFASDDETAYAPVELDVYKPNGVRLFVESCMSYYSGCGVGILADMAGVYSIVVRPISESALMSFRTTLSTELVEVIDVNVAKTLSIPRRGQNARLTFLGTVGEALSLRMPFQAMVPSTNLGERQVDFRIYGPDGSHLMSGAFPWMSEFDLPSLPDTGQYEVVIDPRFGETLQAELILQSR